MRINTPVRGKIITLLLATTLAAAPAGGIAMTAVAADGDTPAVTATKPADNNTITADIDGQKGSVQLKDLGLADGTYTVTFTGDKDSEYATVVFTKSKGGSTLSDDYVGETIAKQAVTMNLSSSDWLTTDFQTTKGTVTFTKADTKLALKNISIDKVQTKAVSELGLPAGDYVMIFNPMGKELTGNAADFGHKAQADGTIADADRIASGPYTEYGYAENIKVTLAETDVVRFTMPGRYTFAPLKLAETTPTPADDFTADELAEVNRVIIGTRTADGGFKSLDGWDPVKTEYTVDDVSKVYVSYGEEGADQKLDYQFTYTDKDGNVLTDASDGGVPAGAVRLDVTVTGKTSHATRTWTINGKEAATTPTDPSQPGQNDNNNQTNPGDEPSKPAQKTYDIDVNFNGSIAVYASASGKAPAGFFAVDRSQIIEPGVYEITYTSPEHDGVAGTFYPSSKISSLDGLMVGQGDAKDASLRDAASTTLTGPDKLTFTFAEGALANFSVSETGGVLHFKRIGDAPAGNNNANGQQNIGGNDTVSPTGSQQNNGNTNSNNGSGRSTLAQTGAPVAGILAATAALAVAGMAVTIMEKRASREH